LIISPALFVRMRRHQLRLPLAVVDRNFARPPADEIEDVGGKLLTRSRPEVSSPEGFAWTHYLVLPPLEAINGDWPRRKLSQCWQSSDPALVGDGMSYGKE